MVKYIIQCQFSMIYIQYTYNPLKTEPTTLINPFEEKYWVFVISASVMFVFASKIQAGMTWTLYKTLWVDTWNRTLLQFGNVLLNRVS